MSAEGAIEVIIHDAPTAWMRLPKFETRLAVQIIAKTREWKGAKVGESRQDWGSRESKRERTVTPGDTSPAGRVAPALQIVPIAGCLRLETARVLMRALAGKANPVRRA
jgi:hypothetical protein